MSLPEYILIALCAAYLLYLAGEKLLLRRCRSSFVHVIHVNGIRGKSSTVRLIDAGLRGGGVRVLSKSTGTLPMILHVDGHEERIERRAPANIREQGDMMRLARREGAQVLVVECMAIHPEGQRASEDMLRADLAVVTNVRPDHTDVMGETREEICDALLSMRPHKGDLFTCEADMAPRMERAMAGRGRVVVIEPRPEGYPGIPDFPENVALALAVCRAAGVSEADALAGMARVRKDPYAFERIDHGNGVFLNAFSANDVVSTLKLYEDQKAEGRLILILNNRRDRPARAEDMSRLAARLPAEEIWVLGEQPRLLKRLLRRTCPRVPVRIFADPGEVPLTFSEKTVLLCAGNIKGAGEALTQRIRDLGKEVGS